MKIAQLLLAGIAIFAIAGGALAFKANRSQCVVFQRNAAGTLCTKKAGIFNPSPAGVLMTHVYTTGASSATTVAISLCTLNISVAAE